MRVAIFSTVSLVALLASNASANVTEFKAGEVVNHIAYDYRQLAKTNTDGLQIKMLTIIETIDAPDSVRALIVAAAAQHEVDAELINAIIAQESNYDTNALSPKGAQGLMQLMPATAKAYGVTDAFDPSQNIDGGILYFKNLLSRYNGNIDFALAAYNAGETAVDKHGGIPPYKETLDYVNRINKRLQRGAYAPQAESDVDGTEPSPETLEAAPKIAPAPLLVFGSGERITD